MDEMLEGRDAWSRGGLGKMKGGSTGKGGAPVVGGNDGDERMRDREGETRKRKKKGWDDYLGPWSTNDDYLGSFDVSDRNVTKGRNP